METKFTKGPWQWEVNEKHKEVNLCGSGIEVLRFTRWGMQGAMPTFTKHGDDVFKLQGVKVTDVSQPVEGREHHQSWFKTIDHPDAHLIAAAPEMYAEIQRDIEHLERQMKFKTDKDEMLPLLRQEHERKMELLAKARGE